MFKLCYFNNSRSQFCLGEGFHIQKNRNYEGLLVLSLTLEVDRKQDFGKICFGFLFYVRLGQVKVKIAP